MGSSVKLVTKDELTTGNYFNADNLIGGENTTIVKDGNVYKINAAAGESTTIESSDESITVTGTATGYDLKVDSAKYQQKLQYFNENTTYKSANIYGNNTLSLEAQQAIDIGCGDYETGMWAIGQITLNEETGLKISTNVWHNVLHAKDTIIEIGDTDSSTTILGNITDKNNNEIFGLTSDNAGDNITITGSGSTLKINAAATVSYPHITDNDKVTISVNGSSNTFAFTADNISSLNTLIANRESYLTQNVADGRYANKTELNYKQDQLTPDNAGDNITITGSGSTLKINATASVNLKFYSESESSAKIETNYSSFEIGDDGTRLSSASELNISSALSTRLSANVVTIGNTRIYFTFDQDSIQALNRHIGKDFVHLTSADWGTMEDGGVYYVDMISDSGPFNFQTGLSMKAEAGKVYTAELHIHYNENIDSPVWPDTWQWVDEDDVTQPTPVPSGSNGKWICYTVRSVNGFTLVHLDHIYGTAS